MFHEGKLSQQFLIFSDQLTLCRTFIQSTGLHLFPTSKAGTAVSLIRVFFLYFI